MLDTKNETLNDNFERSEQMFRESLGYLLEFTTPANPKIETVQEHRLGRIPKEYIQTYFGQACLLIPGETEWTETKISFKGTIGNSIVKVRIR